MAELAVGTSVRPKTCRAPQVGSCDPRPLTTALVYVSSTSRSLSVVVYSGFSGLPIRGFNSSCLAFVHGRGLRFSAVGLPLAITRNGTLYLPCTTPHGKNLARNQCTWGSVRSIILAVVVVYTGNEWKKILILLEFIIKLASYSNYFIW